MIFHVVSVSGGKGGAATLLMAIARFGRARIVAIFCDIDSDIFARNNIWKAVEWSRTSRGGRQFDMPADLIEPTACASAYGLCDLGEV